MKWRPKNPRDWHRWFAWRPVWLFNKGERVWWEWVECRYVGGIAVREYRTAAVTPPQGTDAT